MNSSPARQTISGVPTNIITGFLGVGKSTAIIHLLQQKPDGERWAVLVNEFGEIGIDGHLLAGQSTRESGIFFREVPGGCMCCTAGLPMQIALNQLLAHAKPHRLLIEPTGLGHPKEVLDVLSADHYRSVLDVKATITLVDARNLTQEKYTQHPTFNQQIEIADIVVGNKQDLYGVTEQALLREYVQRIGKPGASIQFCEHGKLDLAMLQSAEHDLEPSISVNKQKPFSSAPPIVADEPSIPDNGVIRAKNQGEGFASLGWRFSPEKVFDRASLLQLFKTLWVDRMKAVMITEQGIFGYNLTPDGLTEIELDECFESRLEIIAVEVPNAFEDSLMQCIVEE